MPHFTSKSQREERLKIMSRETAAGVALANDYMARTGMTIASFSRAIGYGRSSVNKWLNGTYAEVAGNDERIRKAVHGFIDRHPAGGMEDEQIFGRFTKPKTFV